MDTFKLLTKGARFEKKKFQNDFKKFKKINNNKNEPAIDDSIVQTSDLDEEQENHRKSRKKLNVDQLRNDHGIIVDGIDIKPPIRSFSDLNLNETLRNNLEKSHYLNPTPIQMQVIPLMLDRRQMIACAPTGSGKTLAFLLPIIIQLKEPKSCGFRAIILAPTRELAKQIHREALWISDGTGLRIHLIKNINLACKKFNPNSKLKYDILITTPKRLDFLLRKDPPAINIQNLEWLVIDECDRLFQATFLPQLASIFNFCMKNSLSSSSTSSTAATNTLTSPTSRFIKMAMFSATYDPNLHEWCKLNLDNIVTVIIGERNKVVETIEQKLVFTGNEAGKLFALKEIINNGCKTPVLIFVNTVRKANFLQFELSQSINISSSSSTSKTSSLIETIHSERKQEYRDKIVQEFRQGKILFLICTELMGRGIDFKAVNLVINYDLPTSIVSYIHNIGRTGRAGRSGTAITFYTLKDEINIFPILNLMKQSGWDIPEHLQKYDRKQILLFEKLNNKKQQQKRRKKRKFIHQSRNSKRQKEEEEN